MTAHKLPFDWLNEQVTIVQVAEHMLGLKLRAAKADELRGCCPISQSTNNRHFCITPSRNRYVCFCDDCKRFKKPGGDAIELVARMRRFDSHLPAAKEIAQHFGLQLPDGAQPAPQPAQQPKGGWDPITYQKGLKPDHEALQDLGLDPETIKAWGGGYATGSGTLGGRLALPLCDLAGKFEHFVGVELKGEDRELKFPKDLTIPFFFGVQMVQEERDLHIVSHPLDALRYFEAGYNVIASLSPITRDALTSLTSLMDAKKITGVEFH